MDWSSKVATARRLITKYGEVATYQRYNVVGTTAQPIVFFPDARLAYAFSMFRMDIDVPEGSLLALGPGDLGFEPNNRDMLTRASGEGPYVISKSNPLNPGGTTILYSFLLDR